MIENTGLPDPTLASDITANKGGKVLKMVKNERMGGYVPEWVSVKTIQDSFESTLDNALVAQGTSNKSQSNDFSFFDLLDMINPLQHIPVVSSIYRELTGDEIKPIGKLVGGTVFGGAVGAGAALVNVVIEEETGRDVAGNAIALAMGDLKTGHKTNPDPEHPENRLNDAVQIAQAPQNTVRNDLPGTLLSFTDLNHEDGFHIERTDAAGGRTAGSFIRKTVSKNIVNDLPPREPITQMQMSRIPTSRYNN